MLKSQFPEKVSLILEKAWICASDFQQRVSDGKAIDLVTGNKDEDKDEKPRFELREIFFNLKFGLLNLIGALL